MRPRIKVGGKAGVHVGKQDEGKEVTLYREKNEVILTTDMPFSKRYYSIIGVSMCVVIVSERGRGLV